MELYRYKVHEEDCYFKYSMIKDDSIFPKLISIKEIVQTNDYGLNRTPVMGLFIDEKNLLTPLYVGDLSVLNIYWGYYNHYSLVIHKYDDFIDLFTFPNSSNVAHSIYYDFLNGRFDELKTNAIAALLPLDSNMEIGTLNDLYD